MRRALVEWFVDHWVEMLVYGGATLLFALLIAGGVQNFRMESRCLARGYPEMHVSVTTYYCVKRVNQSDVVVPLDSLR